MADDSTSHTITLQQAEAQIHQLTHLTAVLVALNTAVAHAHNQVALFDEVCRIAVKVGELPLAWIGHVE
ncbi:MAG TPA: hypothetical protein VMP08_16565 [Anaerolineae bacterium]|nr:hypothetical protein [Anaerolineae bacterium]